MRILQIAPIWERVPPPAYGGTEAVVFDLVEELVRRGHEVTLWATGDSLTSARLCAVYPQPLRAANEPDPARCERLHARAAMAEADGYAIIHNHAGESVMALAGRVQTPMLTTMHCIITPATQPVWDTYSGYFNTISWSEWRLMPPVRQPRFAGVVYNGIDVESFPFDAEKEDYLLYLSRIAPEKGTHLAIEVARRSGRRRLIAGKVDRVDRQYFEGAAADRGTSGQLPG